VGSVEKSGLIGFTTGAEVTLRDCIRNRPPSLRLGRLGRGGAAAAEPPSDRCASATRSKSGRTGSLCEPVDSASSGVARTHFPRAASACRIRRETSSVRAASSARLASLACASADAAFCTGGALGCGLGLGLGRGWARTESAKLLGLLLGGLGLRCGAG
jgi:hypothetical protein